MKCTALRQSPSPLLPSGMGTLDWHEATVVVVQAPQIVLPARQALSSNGGWDEAICSTAENQFSSSKDETTKQDIDLEIKRFLKTSHIL